MSAPQLKESYEESSLYRIRHSAAHVMAQAVLKMFPDAKIAIGPPIADGFYYDFDLPRTLTPEDLETIEKSMRHLLKQPHRFERREVSESEARELFTDQPYKIELIDDLVARGEEVGEAPVLTTYQHDDFEDLCAGPHVESTGKINPKAVKITHVSGAYWRGDERRPMLQRIYGTAFAKPAELREHLERLERAKQNDHRLLGKKLGLFSISEKVGPGLILWHPKGAKIRALAERFSQDAHVLNGYEWVYSPHIGRANLWETSGHLDFYKEGMFAPIETDGEEYYLKPMNCPFHAEIYKSQPRSYRDLPLRFAEFGAVYRFERSGTLHGLTRVRGFTQDDAHTFCRPEQAHHEILLALRFSLYVLRAFGLDNFEAYVSTRPPEKSIGSDEAWDNAIDALKTAVEAVGLPYSIDEGGGAFYGPKIDLKLKDSVGRDWQLSTVQFDFNLPERFELEYTGEDGQAHRPYMVHRALFGSAERFFAMLIEHYGGAFPLWIAPVQVKLIPITDDQVEFARQVATRLEAEGMRVEVDDSDNRMQAKVRTFEIEKVPYAFVIGQREVEAGQVAVRSRGAGRKAETMTVDEFLEKTAEERAQGRAEALDWSETDSPSQEASAES